MTCKQERDDQETRVGTAINKRTFVIMKNKSTVDFRIHDKIDRNTRLIRWERCFTFYFVTMRTVKQFKIVEYIRDEYLYIFFFFFI